LAGALGELTGVLLLRGVREGSDGKGREEREGKGEPTLKL